MFQNGGQTIIWKIFPCSKSELSKLSSLIYSGAENNAAELLCRIWFKSRIILICIHRIWGRRKINLIQTNVFLDYNLYKILISKKNKDVNINFFLHVLGTNIFYSFLPNIKLLSTKITKK